MVEGLSRRSLTTLHSLSEDSLGLRPQLYLVRHMFSSDTSFNSFVWSVLTEVGLEPTRF